jgi:molecular chaperone GrpE
MNEVPTSDKENCCAENKCGEQSETHKNGNEDEVKPSAEETKADTEEQSFKEKFYYLAAEHDNFKKRYEREKVNILKFGLESVLKDLVEVVDNFERTVSALKNDQDDKVKNIVTGINMVRDQFLDVLKKQGLSQIDAKDKDFDPNYHEALTSVEAAGKKSNVVVDEFQKGYILNGRLLRASKVVVSK